MFKITAVEFSFLLKCMLEFTWLFTLINIRVCLYDLFSHYYLNQITVIILKEIGIFSKTLIFPCSISIIYLFYILLYSVWEWNLEFFFALWFLTHLHILGCFDDDFNILKKCQSVCLLEQKLMEEIAWSFIFRNTLTKYMMLSRYENNIN